MGRRSTLLLVVLGLVAPTPAAAHFVLVAPATWMSQDDLGLPIKLGPCGDEGGGTPTGIVTPFRPGQTITVTINETIFHPGHYRIALAVHDRSELPAEPPVTPGSTTPCGTVPIQNPAVFPVLADGVLVHTAPFSGPRSTTVTLPADVTCTKCTLQVLEFMSEHGLNDPGGCFYHHCADISIQPGAVGHDPNAGSGCAAISAPPSAGFLALVAAALLRGRRSKREIQGDPDASKGMGGIG